VWCAHKEGEVHHGRFCAWGGAEMVSGTGTLSRLLLVVRSESCIRVQNTWINVSEMHALQKYCKKPCDEPCSQCWKPSAEAPGHVCINLGSSYLSQPNAQLEVNWITTSSVDDLMLLPVSVSAATSLTPGMANKVLAEALLVCSSLRHSVSVFEWLVANMSNLLLEPAVHVCASPRQSYLIVFCELIMHAGVYAPVHYWASKSERNEACPWQRIHEVGVSLATCREAA
jgi:hypothetical protein